MAPISRAALFARAFRARAGTTRQSFNRLSRRTYASGNGHGTSGPTLQSEFPWIIGSLGVTAGGCYLLWPEAPKYGKGHGHEHDDHAEHKEEEDEGKEESAESDEGSEDKDSKSDEDKDSKSDDDKDSKSDEDKEQKEDDDSSSKDTPDEKEEKKDDDTKEDSAGDEGRSDGNTEVKSKDAKGGIKKRLESNKSIKQGGENGKSSDVHSGSGENVYNTDTKHSTDVSNDSGKSTKGEGDPETAKLKTTVDPKRPQK